VILGGAYNLRCALVVMALTAGCSAAQPPAVVAPVPLRAVAPAGQTAWPFSYGIEARGAQAPAPDELRRLLKVGAPYLWQVSRVDQNGQEVDQSDLTAFSVR
jgi:hypothetical protein